ncbi:MAG: enoyl-CoA hydratase/isomerase family protein [Gammaproteobacteria bacterium]|nr:MAG: enoyl-CoA hydratase/isomerase family protein [Gammaproteobacteria bacterium]
MDWPNFTTLQLDEQSGVVHIWLNRPDVRNAMSLDMVNELNTLFEIADANPAIRALVLRGKGGHFCAGGDIRDMANARARAAKGDGDPFFELNRAFGRMITRANRVACPLVAVLEGAVLGGGFGLACVSDIALAHAECQFGLPETGLGIPPAQIAPFVVQRIGLTRARALALTGARFDGRTALHYGLVHETAETAEALEQTLENTLEQIRRCAPAANRTTKRLLLETLERPLEKVLDEAARDFSAAIQGEEGQEGTLAFMQKRKPRWAEEPDNA